MKKSKVFRIVALVLVFVLSLTMTVGVFADGDPPPEPTAEESGGGEGEETGGEETGGEETGGEETGGEETGGEPEPVDTQPAPEVQSFAAPAAADSGSGEVGSTTTNPDPTNVVDANNNDNYHDDCDHNANCEGAETGDPGQTEDQHTFVSDEEIEVVVVHTGSKNEHNHFIDFESGTPEDCGASAVYCGTEEYDSNTGQWTYTIYGNDGFDGNVQGISNTTYWNTDDDPPPTEPPPTEPPPTEPPPTEPPPTEPPPTEPPPTEPPPTEPPQETATPVPGPSNDPKTGAFDGGLIQVLFGLLGMTGSGFGLWRAARKEV